MLEEGESLKMCQNDMTSAFYLFKLPPCWLRFLAFNLVVNGSETGRDACQVLPMGWSSAVSVMQEVSQLLVESQGMPGTMQVMRHKPLPKWLVETSKQGKGEGRGWFHVYLDNFFSGEKVVGGEEQKIAENIGLQKIIWYMPLIGLILHTCICIHISITPPKKKTGLNCGSMTCPTGGAPNINYGKIIMEKPVNLP